MSDKTHSAIVVELFPVSREAGIEPAPSGSTLTMPDALTEVTLHYGIIQCFLAILNFTLFGKVASCSIAGGLLNPPF
jgi:hypothetical protein